MRLEAALQVIGRCVVDGGRAEQAGRADPDVQTAKAVENLIDEDDGFFLFGDVERVGYDFCLGVCVGDRVDKVVVGIRACGLIAGCIGSS